MQGLDRNTGRAILGDDYLIDRIQSCLSMRQGTHPMRRLKGSRLPSLLDRPLNDSTLFEIKLAAIDALSHPDNGLTDLIVKKVSISHVDSGVVALDVVIEQSGMVKNLTGIQVRK